MGNAQVKSDRDEVDEVLFAANADIASLKKGGERILVVDDEKTNLLLMKRILQRDGYSNIALVENPRDVLDTYSVFKPDLIILDIRMPSMDGYQVLEELKALNDPLMPPVIFLTAQPGKTAMLRALEHGARDFIAKPFDMNEILMRVRNLLDAHLAHRLVQNQKNVLEEMVRARTEELWKTRLQVVQRLGMAAEYRDEETGNHIMRMSHMAAYLAGCIGWRDSECELLLHASPMHDIGKIGIPDRILKKQGRLDPGEWIIMKSHTTIGARMLSGDDSDLMTMAAEIARSHHEKWNGGGYPDGLAGEAIPVAARIASIADVYDALLSSRPYKEAWSKSAGVDFLTQHSGRHFDPALVQIFIGELPAIDEIRERFTEPGYSE